MSTLIKEIVHQDGLDSPQSHSTPKKSSLHTNTMVLQKKFYRPFEDNEQTNPASVVSISPPTLSRPNVRGFISTRSIDQPDIIPSQHITNLHQPITAISQQFTHDWFFHPPESRLASISSRPTLLRNEMILDPTRSHFTGSRGNGSFSDSFKYTYEQSSNYLPTNYEKPSSNLPKESTEYMPNSHYLLPNSFTAMLSSSSNFRSSDDKGGRDCGDRYSHPATNVNKSEIPIHQQSLLKYLTEEKEDRSGKQSSPSSDEQNVRSKGGEASSEEEEGEDGEPEVNLIPRTKKNSKLQERQRQTLSDDRRRYRTAFSPEQLATLEKEYSKQNYVTRPQRSHLSAVTGLLESTIKIWYQNRRMKDKRLRMTIAWPYPQFPDPRLYPYGANGLTSASSYAPCLTSSFQNYAESTASNFIQTLQPAYDRLSYYNTEVQRAAVGVTRSAQLTQGQYSQGHFLDRVGLPIPRPFDYESHRQH